DVISQAVKLNGHDPTKQTNPSMRAPGLTDSGLSNEFYFFKIYTSTPPGARFGFKNYECAYRVDDFKEYQSLKQIRHL
ncbi:hypothetical protein, partial [Curvibacter gracilis]|uniref:hypothetical protein n=1 Tax=Curvibacter gracilis TaxID=230310 RepID=UPI001B80456A